jgi:hypothetical protein
MNKQERAWLAKYKRTTVVIEAAIRNKPNRYGVLLSPWGELRLHYGEPFAEVLKNSHGWQWWLRVTVDWIDTVHEEDISLVDGFLVLAAQRSPRRVECDAAWLACVAVPVKGRDDRDEVEIRNTCLIRWQGQVHSGKTQQAALSLCQQDYTDALVGTIEPNEED